MMYFFINLTVLAVTGYPWSFSHEDRGLERDCHEPG